LNDWPADLQLVLAAIGRAMEGGRLTPQAMARVPGRRGAILPGHEVRLYHLPKGVAARYVIELVGDRWEGGQWSFRSGELEQLARAACASHT
jgi:hypothetical protein